MFIGRFSLGVHIYSRLVIQHNPWCRKGGLVSYTPGQLWYCVRILCVPHFKPNPPMLSRFVFIKLLYVSWYRRFYWAIVCLLPWLEVLSLILYIRDRLHLKDMCKWTRRTNSIGSILLKSVLFVERIPTSFFLVVGNGLLFSFSRYRLLRYFFWLLTRLRRLNRLFLC